MHFSIPINSSCGRLQPLRCSEPPVMSFKNHSLQPLRCSGIVLNLDGGRQVVLPESDAVTTGSPTIVDIRQRPEIETITDTWKEFMEDPAGWFI